MGGARTKPRIAAWDSTLGFPGEGGRRNLRRTRLDPQYRRNLQKAWGRLEDYCREHDLNLRDKISTRKGARELLIDYIQMLRNKKKPISNGVHVILSV